MSNTKQPDLVQLGFAAILFAYANQIGNDAEKKEEKPKKDLSQVFDKVIETLPLIMKLFGIGNSPGNGDFQSDKFLYEEEVEQILEAMDFSKSQIAVSELFDKLRTGFITKNFSELIELLNTDPVQ